jgi:hypothetical protein
LTEEPSVLDYVKARLTPWRGPAPHIPHQQSSLVVGADNVQREEAGAAPSVSAIAVTLPWAAAAAFGLALAAQLALEPHPGRSWHMGVILYLAAFILLGIAAFRGQWNLASHLQNERHIDPLSMRLGTLWLGIGMGLVAFALFAGNRFDALNVTLWVLSVFLVSWSFWLGRTRLSSLIDPFFASLSPQNFLFALLPWILLLSAWIALMLFMPFNLILWVITLFFFLWAFWPVTEHKIPWPDRFSAWVNKPGWQLSFTPWNLLVLACAGLILFFRLHQIETVPSQMVSDQAEKLLDVWDVLQGQLPIFFLRNTGREPLQFYLTAGVIKIFDTGISFLSLKIGTVFAGLLTLPFIYLLGKEVGSSRIGLLAMTMAGIAYWPNVISRVGLRFPLYPLFAAPVLFFLLRGIRRSNRNDFILSGLFLGVGLYGYTPIRILPFVLVAAVILYLLHRNSAGMWRQTIWSLVVLAFVSLMVFLPLLRYSLTDLDAFGYRAFSRLGVVERPLPGPIWEIFLRNTWDALVMFSWDNGEIWPVSVTHRPVLDVVSGALFHVGVVLLLIRYLRRRHWLDLFLLISIPLLMLPSILSLAYPAENPAPNRASAAMIPVFLIAAIALDGLLETVKKMLRPPWGRSAAWGLVIFLLIWSASQNYHLVFQEYKRSYELSSWNTSEMGQVIARFSASAGSLDTSWVVAYPHWVDTRLVGMIAGQPTRDFAITPDLFDETIYLPGPKLFLINLQDTAAVDSLQTLYPNGWLQQYDSQYEYKDFLVFIAPP